MKTFIVKANSKTYSVKTNDFRSAVKVVKVITAKDDASQLDVIQALVTDEQAAIAAYTNAIANLEGKVDPQYLEVLRNILKEENKHVENLQAIITGNVTEKNVEDSAKDDGFWSEVKPGEHVYIEYREAGRRLATSPGKTVFKGREGGMIVVNMNGKELRIPENMIAVRTKDSVKDEHIKAGAEFKSKSGHKIKIVSIDSVEFSPFDGSVLVRFTYDYEMSDGKKGRGAGNNVDLYRMLKE